MFVALLAYYFVFFVVTFPLPVWRFWRREAISPLILTNDDSAHGFVILWFKLLIAAVFGLVVALAAGFDPKQLGVINAFGSQLPHWLGISCLALSIPIIVLAQIEMGRSWRIGIDQERRTALVTGGIFRLSRNPIFLGMTINLLGLVLLVPTVVTLALFLFGVALMGVQVRLEEAHLLGMLGEPYQAYRKQVRRWL